VSKHHRVFATTSCRVSGETERDDRAHAQQAGRGCNPSMYVNRRRAPMKSRIRQIHFRQYKDQHDEKQQAHQHQQGRRFYGPTPHASEGTTKFDALKTPRKCHTSTEGGSSDAHRLTRRREDRSLTPPATRSCWHRPENARRNARMPLASTMSSNPPHQPRNFPARSWSGAPHQTDPHRDCRPRPSHR
jgi:hypothetical protein